MQAAAAAARPDAVAVAVEVEVVAVLRRLPHLHRHMLACRPPRNALRR